MPGPLLLGGTRLPANHDSEDGPDWDPADEGITRTNERQRIARELHDSTSQLLVVLQLQFSQLNEIADPEAERIIAECKHTIREIQQQIRALNSD